MAMETEAMKERRRTVVAMMDLLRRGKVTSWTLNRDAYKMVCRRLDEGKEAAV